MARPQKAAAISSGTLAWDAAVEDNFEKIFTTPFPVPKYASFGVLPSAASYEGCLATAGGVLYFSDGAAWKTVTVT